MTQDSERREVLSPGGPPPSATQLEAEEATQRSQPWTPLDFWPLSQLGQSDPIIGDMEEDDVEEPEAEAVEDAGVDMGE